MTYLLYLLFFCYCEFVSGMGLKLQKTMWRHYNASSDGLIGQVFRWLILLFFTFWFVILPMGIIIGGVTGLDMLYNGLGTIIGYALLIFIVGDGIWRKSHKKVSPQTIYVHPSNSRESDHV